MKVTFSYWSHFSRPKTGLNTPIAPKKAREHDIEISEQDIAKILADAKKVEEVVDTDEETTDLIQGLMDGMEKYAIGGTLSMSGIVKCMWVNGMKNTDEHRKIAIDYVRNELGLKIR